MERRNKLIKSTSDYSFRKEDVNSMRSEEWLSVPSPYPNLMYSAVLWPLARCQASHLAPRALFLLLNPCGVCSRLSVPVHTDEAIIKNCFSAGYGPSGLFILCILDQRRLWVSTKHHLDEQQNV